MLDQSQINSPISYSSGWMKEREMFPRIPQSPKKSPPPPLMEETIDKPPQGPGIFFDMSKSQQAQEIKRKTSNPNVEHALISKKKKKKSSNSTSQQSQFQESKMSTSLSSKLYSPHEYLHYATKVNFSKESYLNSLQQLGYQNISKLNEKPYNDIVTKTEGILSHSYSLKYLGVIDGNMGILSKRMKFQQKPSTEIVQQQQQTIKSNKTKNINTNTFSLEPNFSNKPDFYNTHLITQYSLPKYLKPIIKDKDKQIQEDKQKLEQWHAQQLQRTNAFNNSQTYLSHQNKIKEEHDLQIKEEARDQVNEVINSGILSSQGLYNSKLKPKKQQSQGSSPYSLEEQHPQQNNNIDYSIIKQSVPPQGEGKSYSRLLIKIDTNPPLQQAQSRDQSTLIKEENNGSCQDSDTNFSRKKQSQSNLLSPKLSRNDILLSRFDHIAKIVSEKNSLNQNQYDPAQSESKIHSYLMNIISP